MIETATINYDDLLQKKTVDIYGRTLTLSDMAPDEVNFFDAHFDGLFGTSDSTLRRILDERKETIFQGVRAIKYKLQGPFFRGTVPGDSELGFSLIRPGHVKGWNRAWAARNQLQDGTAIGWRQQYASAMIWTDWLSSAAATPFVLSRWHGLIITHLASQNSPTPFTVGVSFNIARIQSVPFDLHHLAIGDNVNNVSFFPVPTQIALPEEGVLARTVGGYLSVVAGVPVIDSLQLGGVCVGIGRFLNQESYGANARYW